MLSSSSGVLWLFLMLLSYKTDYIFKKCVNHHVFYTVLFDIKCKKDI